MYFIAGSSPSGLESQKCKGLAGDRNLIPIMPSKEDKNKGGCYIWL